MKTSLNPAQASPQRRGSERKRTSRRPWRWLLLLAILTWTLLSFRADSVSPAQEFEVQLGWIIAGKRFDLIGWSTQAAFQKAIANLRYPAPKLAGLHGSGIVMEYLRVSQQVGNLEGEINRAYAGLPQSSLPPTEIRQLEGELASLRSRQRSMQPLVETILERQVARVLAREGLTTAGAVWPPVLFRFTPLPHFLVISPREEISITHSDDLQPGIPVSQKQEMEERIDLELQVSSLIENIGGYGTYPAMVLEHASLTWLTNVIAHEWAHNYLVFHPLGMYYQESSAVRTMNETVATLVGDEIGALVIQDYYPWIEPPALSWQTPPPDHLLPPSIEEVGVEEPRFEFGPFMRETRLEADRRLAEGDVEGAELYMERRRQELLEHGYVIRKLNQAYFAFHGMYATSPGAVDPIGPKMEDLRRRSPSLGDFLRIVRKFRAKEDLDLALEEFTAGPEPRKATILEPEEE